MTEPPEPLVGRIIAVTGATGFVGGHVLQALGAAGCRVRALTRQAAPAFSGRSLDWVKGDLESRDALARLCDGADAVVHIAGAIKARDRAGFFAANADGTQAMVTTARDCGTKRFIHVSSLAAREPSLSHYAASKAEAERHVRQSGLDWTILRPPAVYGPGDRETLQLFRLARWRLMPQTGGGRVSLIHVSDLAQSVCAALAAPQTIHHSFDVHDGRARGYTPGDIRDLLAAAGGHAVLPLPLPRPLAAMIAAGAELAGTLQGRPVMLTRQKLAELYHADWTSDDDRLCRLTGWQARIDAVKGFCETRQWYVERGWL